ncbi:hypothetical protein TrST_g3095 [Triparma strigata]|uniref:Anaphase-promoting complex subunit 4-like WD40 domain-containing protein n=1 Tax=Triparma strigata TaxID=1606541 RepID=A0A9W7BIR7_9STRA|nr:hypothetical protein TrST_g3095 [Triparma strigata]
MALYRILHRHEVSQNAAPAFDVKFTTESSDTSPSYKLVTGSSPSLSLWRATPKLIEEASLSALSMIFTEMARVDDAHGGLAIVGVESLGQPEDDDDSVATLGLDSTVKCWRLSKREEEGGTGSAENSEQNEEGESDSASFQPTHAYSLTNTLDKDNLGSSAIKISVSPDKALLACATINGLVKLFRVKAMEEIASFEVAAVSLAWSESGKVLKAGCADGNIVAFDLDEGRKKWSTRCQGSMVRCMASSKDDGLLFAGCDDKIIFVFDPLRERTPLVASYEGHDGWIFSLKAHVDATRFATASADKTVKVWDMLTKKCQHTFEGGHSKAVFGLDLLGNGRRMASCGEDGLVQIYSID